MFRILPPYILIAKPSSSVVRGENELFKGRMSEKRRKLGHAAETQAVSSLTAEDHQDSASASPESGIPELETPEQQRRGPRSVEESMHWASQYLDIMSSEYPVAFENVRKKFASRGLCLVSDYSGMGCAEIAMAQIHQTLREKGCEAHMCVHRASDLKAQCRQVLLEHSGPSALEHVFGDLTTRIDDTQLDELTQLQKETELEFSSRVAAGEQAKTVREELGASMETSARRILSCNRYADRACFKAWCFKHQTECPVWPEVRKGCSQGGITIAVAGVTCTDYSAMGKRRGQVGPAMVPFWVWSHEVAFFKPEIVLVECTVSIALSSLQLFTAEYHISHRVVTPTDLGFAASRPRRYILLMRKDIFAGVDAPWTLEDPSSEFARRFHRRREFEAKEYFMSSDQEQHDEVILPLAFHRGLPPCGMCGRRWKLVEVVAPGVLESLQEYKEQARRLGEDCTVNLQQTPQFMSAVPHVCPTLLQGSMLYNTTTKKVHGFCFPETTTDKPNIRIAVPKSNTRPQHNRASAPFFLSCRCEPGGACEGASSDHGHSQLSGGSELARLPFASSPNETPSRPEAVQPGQRQP